MAWAGFGTCSCAEDPECGESLQRDTSRKAPDNLKAIFEAINGKSGSADGHFTWNRLTVFQEGGRSIKGVGIKKKKKRK